MRTMSVTAMCALGPVFFLAVSGKIRTRSAYSEFVSSLEQYGFRRRATVRAVGFLTVCAELISAGAVFLAPLEGWSTFLQFAPAVVMLTLLSLAVARGNRLHPGDLRCHCFGSDDRTDPRLHIVINGVLIMLAVLAIVQPAGVGASPGAEFLGAGLGLLVGAVAITLPGVIRTLRVTVRDGAGSLS